MSSAPLGKTVIARKNEKQNFGSQQGILWGMWINKKEKSTQPCNAVQWTMKHGVMK